MSRRPGNDHNRRSPCALELSRDPGIDAGNHHFGWLRAKARLVHESAVANKHAAFGRHSMGHPGVLRRVLQSTSAEEGWYV